VDWGLFEGGGINAKLSICCMRNKNYSAHVQCFSMRDTKRELLHFLILILVRFILYHTTPPFHPFLSNRPLIKPNTIHSSILSLTIAQPTMLTRAYIVAL